MPCQLDRLTDRAFEMTRCLGGLRVRRGILISHLAQDRRIERRKFRRHAGHRQQGHQRLSEQREQSQQRAKAQLMAVPLSACRSPTA